MIEMHNIYLNCIVQLFDCCLSNSFLFPIMVNKKNDLNLISKKVESLYEYFLHIIHVCVINLPKFQDSDPNTIQETLVNYFTYFWDNNFPLEDSLKDIADISVYDPINSFISFRKSISYFQKLKENMDKNPNFQAKTKMPLDILKLEHSDKVVELLMNVASAIFLRLLVTNSEFQKKEAIPQIYKLIYNIAFNFQNINQIVLIVSAKYWARVLNSISLSIQKLVFDSLFSLFQKLNGITTNQFTIIFIFFTGFNIQYIDSLYIEKFNTFLTEFSKIYRKILNPFIDSSFTEFVVNFLVLSEVSCSSPTIEGDNIKDKSKSTLQSILSKSWAILAKFLKPVAAKADTFLSSSYLQILAHAICFEDPKNKTKDKINFIENTLTQSLTINGDIKSVLKSFNILLNEKYINPYCFEDTMDDTNKSHYSIISNEIIDEKITDLIVQKIVDKTTLFSTTQFELYKCLLQLSTVKDSLFFNKYFHFFINESFLAHNILAIAMLISNDFMTSKVPNKNQLSLSYINKFMVQSQIRLAPINLPIFQVHSIIALLEKNSKNISPSIITLNKYSLPQMAVQFKHSTGIIKKKINQIFAFLNDQNARSSLNLQNFSLEKISPVFEENIQNDIRFDGFVSFSEMKKHEETIMFLNLMGTADVQIIECLCSFIFSSSILVSSLVIHILQVLIYSKPQSIVINTIFLNVCKLVKLCPIIENNHLYRILYALQNLTDIINYLSEDLNDQSKGEICNVAVLGLCSPHFLIRNLAMLLLNSYFSDFSQIINNDNFNIQCTNLVLKNITSNIDINSNQIINERNPLNFSLSFTSALKSKFNNLFQFFLASLAKELRLIGKVQQIHEYLLKQIKFFEIDSLDPSLLQNLLVFLFNSASHKFYHKSELHINHDIEFLMQIASKIGRQCSPALFCAIDSKLMTQLLCPFYELLAPLSFSLSMVMDSSIYDEQFVLKALDEMVDIVIEKCHLSTNSARENDIAVFHVIRSMLKHFEKVIQKVERYRYSIFPIRKTVVGKIIHISNEAKWVAFIMLISRCTDTLQSLARKTMAMVIRLSPFDEAFWEGIFAAAEHHLILYGILCHYPTKVLNKYIELAYIKDKYFKAICMLFETFENIEKFNEILLLNLNAKKNVEHDEKQEDDNDYQYSEAIYKNCGYLLALAFCYMFSEKYTLRLNASNLFAAISIPCAHLNGLSIEEKVFELKLFLTDSLIVVFHQKLQEISEILYNSLSFCSEQFLCGVLSYLQVNQKFFDSGKGQENKSSQMIINYIKPFFSSMKFPDQIIAGNSANFKVMSFYEFFSKLSELQITPDIFQNLDEQTLKFSIAFVVETCQGEPSNNEDSKKTKWGFVTIQHFYEMSIPLTLSTLIEFLTPTCIVSEKIKFVLRALYLLSHSPHFLKHINIPKLISFCYVNFTEYSVDISILLSSIFPSISSVSEIEKFLTYEQACDVGKNCFEFGMTLRNSLMASKSLETYCLFDSSNREEEIDRLYEKLENEDNIDLLKVILRCIRLKVSDDKNSIKHFWRICKLAQQTEIQNEVFDILFTIINFDIFKEIEKPDDFNGFLPFVLNLIGDLNLFSIFLEKIILKDKSNMLVYNQNEDSLILFKIDSFPIEISKKARKKLFDFKNISEPENGIQNISLIAKVVDFTYKNLTFKIDNKLIKFATYLIDSNVNNSLNVFSSISAKIIQHFIFSDNLNKDLKEFLSLLNNRNADIPSIEKESPVDSKSARLKSSATDESDFNSENPLITKSKEMFHYPELNFQQILTYFDENVSQILQGKS